MTEQMPGPGEGPEVYSQVEFDNTQYPDHVSGFAMPAVGEAVEVEIVDSAGGKRLVGVPAAAVRRLNMPRVGADLPPEVKAPFEAGIGLAMVACRVEEGPEEGSARVTLPGVRGAVNLRVPAGRIVRKAQTPDGPADNQQSQIQNERGAEVASGELKEPTIENLAAACAWDDETGEGLDEETIEGLREITDPDDFFTAITEELADAGVEDVEAFLRSRRIKI